ncbi:outer membrane efflux protein [Flammeovirgaceae bacterium 311]|nr:outer membrane efflux protein [Flammeovirgaceae bacterium 311]
MNLNWKTAKAMRTWILIIVTLLLSLPMILWAQGEQQKTLSLEELVALARQGSVDALIAQTAKETGHWQYRSYKADLHPQLALQGTLPDFSRTFSPITQPDGTIQFQPIVNNNSALNLQLTQNVGLTGGQFFVNSQLQRFDDLERDFTRYNGSPVGVGYRQSIFSFNPYRWARQIEPLRYEASRRQFLSDLEAVSLQVTAAYFQLLLAQIDYEMAQQNVENGRKALEIAQLRFDMGKISQNDLLQMKYSLLNAQRSLADARQDMQTSFLQLKTLAGIEGSSLRVEEPRHVPQLYVEEELALKEAQKNKETVINFQVRLLEARRAMNKAKSEGGLNADLFASVGLVNRADHWNEVYQNPVNQQMITISFTIPVVDWGRNKARVMTAEANQKLTEYAVKQDQQVFEQQIGTQVALIESLSTQVEVSKEAAELANERYGIAGESFAMGRISITELNIAQAEKDTARRNYLQALRGYWETYYRLRLLTLYDFELQEPITMSE